MTDETQGVPTPPEPEPEPAHVPEPLTLIYLDVDDEITSAAARIRGAAAERVALVLPYGSRLATSRINFRLLAREATERGKRLELICADASARSLALAAGLPVHPSVAAFEGRGPAAGTTGGGTDSGAATGAIEGLTGTAPGVIAAGLGPEADADDHTNTRVIPVPRRKPARVPMVGPARPPVRPRLAIVSAVGLLVLILVGGAIAVDQLPSATIVLHPRSEELGPLGLSIEARTDAVVPDEATLVIPAQLLTFELAAGDTFPATGQKTVEAKATGTVTFSNFDTGRGVVVPAGSIVQTQKKIQFVTLAEVTLPRAQVDFFPPFSVHPSTQDVAIEAVLAGEGGNVGNNSIVDIPKGGRNVFATNAEATAGGEISSSPRISQADVDAAKAAIGASLVTDLDQQVAAGTGVPETVTLFPETRTVLEPAYNVDPTTLVGQEGAEFDLSATAQGTAIGVDERPIAGIAESRLRAGVRAGWTLVPETISTDIGAPAILGTILSYPVTVSGTQVHDPDEPALRAAIAGLVIADARSRLDDFGDVEITVWPDWVTKLPTHQDRITFEFAAPQPSASPPP